MGSSYLLLVNGLDFEGLLAKAVVRLVAENKEKKRKKKQKNLFFLIFSSQRVASSMFLRVLGVAALLVLGQPLRPVEHAALMSVYSGLNCNATACPRFAADANCTGAGLVCASGNVVSVYVKLW